MMNFVFFFLFFLILGLVGPSNSSSVYEWEVGGVGHSAIKVGVSVDSSSLVFGLVVLYISFNVAMFSLDYMPKDTHGFKILVSLFVVSMLLLIFSSNLVFLMVGWDGLGLCSYLLVIYYSKPSSLSAGMLTALTNRLGDSFLMLTIALTSNNWFFLSFLSWSGMASGFFFISAMTKSAQVPFSSWLPAAMSAPTPVSALVHSSTLVTAGVYIVIRAYPNLECMAFFSVASLCAGCLTSLMAGICAFWMEDVKKVVALSTLSQLGLMFIALGLKMPDVALFHLLTHAMFKSLLFVCVGYTIHLCGHNQDCRLSGGSYVFISVGLVVSSLSLCGCPFMAGFYSKDLILESGMFSCLNLICTYFGLISTGFTGAYSCRLLLVLLWGPLNSDGVGVGSEANMKIPMPILSLSVGSICFGSIMNWVLFYDVTPPLFFSNPGLDLGLVGGLGVVGGLIWRISGSSLGSTMWGVSSLNQGFGGSVLFVSLKTSVCVDQGWLMDMSGGSLIKFLHSLSQFIFSLQGRVYSIMVCGHFVVFLGVFPFLID